MALKIHFNNDCCSEQTPSSSEKNVITTLVISETQAEEESDEIHLLLDHFSLLNKKKLEIIERQFRSNFLILYKQIQSPSLINRKFIIKIVS